MKSALLTGAAIALIGGAAFAQAPAPGAAPPATTPPATVKPPAATTPPTAPAIRSDPAPAARTGSETETSTTGAVNSAAGFKVGSAVKDSTGAEIGTISQVTKDGVVLQIGTQSVTVPQAALTMQGGSIVSSKSKADLTAKSPG